MPIPFTLTAPSEDGSMSPIDLSSPTLGFQRAPKVIALQGGQDQSAEFAVLLHTVASSNVLAIGFNRVHELDDEHPANTGRLFILFRNGGLYQYSGVPLETAAKLLCAESIGSAFAKLVKAGGFTSMKLS
jgi:hypothetical protein